jgi:hypothetical protein
MIRNAAGMNDSPLPDFRTLQTQRSHSLERTLLVAGGTLPQPSRLRQSVANWQIVRKPTSTYLRGGWVSGRFGNFLLLIVLIVVLGGDWDIRISTVAAVPSGERLFAAEIGLALLPHIVLRYPVCADALAFSCARATT